MGVVSDRLRALHARMTGAPPPDVREAVRKILVDGKREQLRAGVDAAGRSYAALAGSTLARGRRVSSTPLVGLRGEASPLLTRYVVDVSGSRGELTAAAGWPGVDHVRYLRSGTGRMPARDPGGFRERDLARARDVVRRWRDG